VSGMVAMNKPPAYQFRSIILASDHINNSLNAGAG